ncbi:TPA: EAL domain-containing protein [Vibrio parahaemolyticus]|uniref:EAL domain-containing protein n=1 Tax=Vibrio parahaemolyticus TaxID=670 RepID=UPI001123BD9E|nr:EAL domain-containing protein [Vibrio parahaemolyticus]TOG38640.1 hypothetical protein CGJ02_23950 [Vibrio parahaemolyticus]HBN6205856.1 EAL domain-containing protein [Vibrio parahaemolyticus]HCH4062496.1 EAL domain-containing protein [Vibrio parahaemolyticus]
MDKQVFKIKYILSAIALVVALFSTVISLHYIIVSKTIYQQEMFKSKQRSQAIITSFDDLVKIGYDTLSLMKKFSNRKCTAELIEQLKLLQFHRYSIQNITVVLDNNEVCSSMLGHYKDLLPLRTADWEQDDYRFWFNVTVEPKKSKQVHAIIEQGIYRINLHFQMLFSLNGYESDSSRDVITYHHHIIASSHPIESIPTGMSARSSSTIGPFEAVVVKSKQMVQSSVFSVFIKTLWVSLLISLLMSIISVQYFKRWHYSFPRQLERGIKNNEIRPYYQPIINAHSGRCIGAEVLCRWFQDDQLVSPNVFIPKVESFGLQETLTRHIVISSLKQLGAFLDENKKVYLSINVSACELSNADFFNWLNSQLQCFNVQTHQIRLELTERQFSNHGNVINILEKYRQHGYLIYIDDFGTGYSSLSYLQHLPLDVLKIDKSFIDSVTLDSATSVVAEHIITMAKSLELDIIAEGVEFEYQKDYLGHLGVHLIQGWLYSPALPYHEWVCFYNHFNKTSKGG